MTAPPAKRVLLTTDAVGGVWVYATDLARGLCQSGSEVTLVITGPAARPEQLEPLQTIDGLAVESTDLALEWLDPEGADMPRARRQLLAIAERVRPDVVHLNSFREASFDWPAPVLIVAHSCVWSWWQACRGEKPDEPRWSIYAAAVAAGLLAADAWAAPSHSFRDCIAARYPTRTRCHVIRNGVDLLPAAARKEAFIFATGRIWDEAKNLEALAAVASQLEWPVRAAGAVKAPDGSQNARSAGAVEWLGVLSRTQIIAQMQRAGIFASPALYEPFGLSILEAAACGCALVLSDIPTLRELWTGAALFVPPRDTDALRNALRTLCRDHRLRAELQCAARVRAKRYSLANTLRGYQELYRIMAAPSPDKTAARSPLMAEAQA
jgi:glycosyltransferase involved in cell wall biosynthesis